MRRGDIVLDCPNCKKWFKEKQNLGQQIICYRNKAEKLRKEKQELIKKIEKFISEHTFTKTEDKIKLVRFLLFEWEEFKINLIKKQKVIR